MFLVSSKAKSRLQGALLNILLFSQCAVFSVVCDTCVTCTTPTAAVRQCSWVASTHPLHDSQFQTWLRCLCIFQCWFMLSLSLVALEQRIELRCLQVSLARPSSDQIKGANLYVGGIPKTWTHKDLDCLFSSFGHIVTSRILCDLQTGNLDFDFIHFYFLIDFCFSIISVCFPLYQVIIIVAILCWHNYADVYFDDFLGQVAYVLFTVYFHRFLS